jgi:metal-responsive CopG/Arc/MetJ family transcriptional regulator
VPERRVQVNCRIPESLLARLDEYAAEQLLGRAVVVKAAIERLLDEIAPLSESQQKGS